MIFPAVCFALAALAVDFLLQQPDHFTELFIFAFFCVQRFIDRAQFFLKGGNLPFQLLAGTSDLINLLAQLLFRLGCGAAHLFDILKNSILFQSQQLFFKCGSLLQTSHSLFDICGYFIIPSSYKKEKWWCIFLVKILLPK